VGVGPAVEIHCTAAHLLTRLGCRIGCGSFGKDPEGAGPLVRTPCRGGSCRRDYVYSLSLKSASVQGGESGTSVRILCRSFRKDPALGRVLPAIRPDVCVAL